MADAYGTATGDASVSADAYNIHGLKENREFAVRKWGSRLRILLALQLVRSARAAARSPPAAPDARPAPGLPGRSLR